MSTSIFSSSPSSRPLSRKLLLLFPLLLCLYLLTDDDYRRHDDGVHVLPNNDDDDGTPSSAPLPPLFPRHHLAFATALSRHPPSLRVFRLCFETVVLLACASLALRCWEGCDDSDGRGSNEKGDDDDGVRITKRGIGRLLFRPPPDAVGSHSAWKAVATHRSRRRRRNRGRRRRREVTKESETKGRETKDLEGVHHLYGKIGTNRDPCRDRSGDEEDGQSRQRTFAETESDADEEAARDLGADSSWEKLSPLSRQNDDGNGDYAENANNHDDGMDEMDDDLRDLIEIPPTPPRRPRPVPDNDNIQEEEAPNDVVNDETKENAKTAADAANDDHSKETPPSASSVMGAALDLLSATCVFLILFTVSSAEGGRYIDKRAGGAIFHWGESGGGPDVGKLHLYGPGTVETMVADGNLGDDAEATAATAADATTISWMELFANIAAPLFPLTLFAMGCVAVILPWKKRKDLWTIVGLTVGAPFYEVTFR